MSKLAELKNESNYRDKVNSWLDHIGCTDHAERDEVLTLCANNKEARAYYADRHHQDCPIHDRAATA